MARCSAPRRAGTQADRPGERRVVASAEGRAGGLAEIQRSQPASAASLAQPRRVLYRGWVRRKRSRRGWKVPWWAKLGALIVAPLCAINLAVGFFGSSWVFPLSPWF